MQKAGMGSLLRERPLILQCSLLVEIQGTRTEMDTQEEMETTDLVLDRARHLYL